MKEGFTIRNIPAQREKVCNGCKYLTVVAMMRGHKENTDNYYCTHPEFQNMKPFLLDKEGRNIHFNHSGSCTTPHWCPFNVKGII